MQLALQCGATYECNGWEAEWNVVNPPGTLSLPFGHGSAANQLHPCLRIPSAKRQRRIPQPWDNVHDRWIIEYTQLRIDVSSINLMV